MHDQLGRELKVGDVVLIPALVTGIALHSEFFNLSAKSIFGRKPDGARGTFCINSHVTFRANRGDEQPDSMTLPPPDCA